MKQITLCIAVSATCLLASCGGSTHSESPAAKKPAPFAVHTSIQDIMNHQVEPAAEALWESVSTSISAEGVEEKRPDTDEEWFALRSHAITLMEAPNLLVMEGRRVLLPGQAMADEGVQGVIAASEVQAKLENERATFVQLAQLLHTVSADMLKAIDARDVQGVLNAGEAIDAACESCHMTFWYPNQVIPELPN